MIYKKILQGIVVSSNSDKTIKVKIERIVKHKKYNKYIKREKTYMVHDSNNVCKKGDSIRIIETRPISKMKRFRIYNVIKKLDEVRTVV